DARDDALGDAGPSTPRCPVATRPDLSSPNHVIGTGTPASCKIDDLRVALLTGGVIVFRCGPDPITLTLSPELVTAADTVIAGDNLVTLDGVDSTRVLRMPFPAHRVTLMDLTIVRGHTTDSGGGVLVQWGDLTIIHSTLRDNHGPIVGPTFGGG